ncbi:hypothetical protein ACOMHN_014057 [Nucella lapillus]
MLSAAPAEGSTTVRDVVSSRSVCRQRGQQLSEMLSAAGVCAGRGVNNCQRCCQQPECVPAEGSTTVRDVVSSRSVCRQRGQQLSEMLSGC